MPTAEPDPTPRPTADPDLTPTPELLDFCATWDDVGPSIIGGPTGPDDVIAYLGRAVDAFAALLEAAEREPEFPQWAYDDLVAYHADLVHAFETGDLTSGDPALRSRIEGFLARYCDGPEAGS